jgi:transmembrane sensor
VGVEQGHVRVRVSPRDGTETPQTEVIDLHAGQLVEVQGGHARAVRQSETRDLSAWRDGWLVFDNTPLGDALASVNSYRNQAIVSTDPRVNALRLSGRFRTNDSAGLVAALTAILPVTAIPRPDGGLELKSR